MLLAIPDRDQDVGRTDERLTDEHVSPVRVSAITRQGHDLVSGLELEFELIELVAGFEIIAILVGVERKDAG
jgi:hypothetical protein